MFDKGSVSYKSDIILGDRYREINTGLEGVATAVFFFQHACERVQLDYVHDGDLKQVAFDAPQLLHLKTTTTGEVILEKVLSTKSGGPIREHQVRAHVGGRW